MNSGQLNTTTRQHIIIIIIIITSGGDHVRMTDDANVDVILAPDLTRGNNNLQRLGVVRAVHGVVQDANRPDNLARYTCLGLGEVARISDDNRRTSDFIPGFDSIRLALLVEEDLVDALVEHKGATMDCAQAGETLR